jgi:nanoRNase/pAp phosphatase (c-di-AMP/oligoRNAs hydrolase)
MDLVLCHTTADFDTLGAAVGLTRLLPGARIVLTGGAILRCSGLWRSIGMSIR